VFFFKKGMKHDTRRHNENKNYIENFLVIFFIQLLAVHQNLKNKLKRQVNAPNKRNGMG